MAIDSAALRVSGLVLGLCGVVCAQASLSFKTATVPPRVGTYADHRLVGLTKTFDVEGPEHFVLEMSSPITPELVAQVTAHGVNVLGYVPSNGLSISIVHPVSFEDLPVVWAAKLEAKQRLSPLLLERGFTARFSAIVEFHPDATAVQMRESAARAAAEVLEHPGLLPSQLLVSAPLASFLRLAQNDAIAYIFPAPDDVVSGQAFASCASGITAAGRLAAYASTSTYGSGWDGAGLNSSTISYTFGPITWKLPADHVRTEVVRALSEWSKYIQVGFWENGNRSSKRNIDISFGSRDHGDGLSFDGPGGTLAHTFYPSPPNPEPIAGDMHLDTDENWTVGGEPDVFSLALHEAGHALGLGHSDDPRDVMYAFYKHVSGLATNDIAVIRTLYAAKPDPPAALIISAAQQASVVTDPAVVLTGTVDGGLGDVTVTWAIGDVQGAANGGRAWTISGLPLNLGVNTIQLTATDSNRAVAALIVIVELSALPEPQLR